MVTSNLYGHISNLYKNRGNTNNKLYRIVYMIKQDISINMKNKTLFCVPIMPSQIDPFENIPCIDFIVFAENHLCS